MIGVILSQWQQIPVWPFTVNQLYDEFEDVLRILCAHIDDRMTHRGANNTRVKANNNHMVFPSFH
jgi:hypothetical protein